MNTNQTFNKLRQIFWPIEYHENKKFLPMALMMFFILFNYSALRSIKDSLVITSIGPEVISFLKTYITLPSAIIAMLIYTKLCNVMNATKVFYTITSFFLGYLILFVIVLYPNTQLIHPAPETIVRLSTNYPNFQWFIKIIGQWSYASFFAIAELWGTVMLTLLFWQFANQITKTEEAKRFYSMFGLLGNFSLLLTGYMLEHFLSENSIIKAELKYTPVITTCIIAGVFIILTYAYINNYVLSDPKLYDPSIQKTTKKKAKLSMLESIKLIFSSKYLGLIVILVLSYGISINLVEGVWKAKARELYPTPEAYGMFMGNFQKWQGTVAILFMIVGSNILRQVSWYTAAIFTPLMILITGLAFFGFIFLGDSISLYVTGIAPLSIAVAIGTMQNVLSKATKYSLFDSTKEMAYIPLDHELKTKGKAAVDIIGGRLGKSGGGVIQSTFFMLLPSFSFVEASPYFGAIFFLVVILWIYSVAMLNRKYTEAIAISSN